MAQKHEPIPLRAGCSGHVGTDLDQVVVRTIKVFVQLDHQALKKRRELLLLLPWLESRETDRRGQLESKMRCARTHMYCIYITNS